MEPRTTSKEPTGKHMIDPANFICERLGNEAMESWKPDHDKAMKCRNLEGTLRLGLLYYNVIRLSDEEVSRKVQLGEIDFDPKLTRSVRKWYLWWLKPCEEVLSSIRVMQANFEVEHAAEFERAFREVTRLVAAPVDELVAA